jgi:Protein of unknown function (DUF3052)
MFPPEVVMAGYSGTPLARKLGIRAGHTLVLIGAPANYRDLVAPLPDDVTIRERIARDADIVHIFSSRRAGLARRLQSARRLVAQDGAIWVSWPKKAAKVPTDVTEDTVRELALPLGLVDVKVCAVDDVWSGLKLVIRKELRRRP